mmetsp:Transcript_14545/g.30040  ORF Transcript_14545/g.30040 Transcript_14545/m.30040 type:complete len:175 (-) Transcript_14545:2674-3198(-)
MNSLAKVTTWAPRLLQASAWRGSNPLLARRAAAISFSPSVCHQHRSVQTFMTSTIANRGCSLGLKSPISPLVRTNGLMSNIAANNSLLSPLFPRLSQQQQQYRGKTTKNIHSGIKKRFRIRANGTLKRYKRGHAHNTGKKSRAHKNRLGMSATMGCKKRERTYKMCLGVSGAKK